MIATVRKVYEGTLIIGGGIRNPDDAKVAAKAGADIIVIGTMLEDNDFEKTLTDICSSCITYVMCDVTWRARTKRPLTTILYPPIISTIKIGYRPRFPSNIRLLLPQRLKGLDPSLIVESPLALDLADRVAKLLEIPIAERLRELLKTNRTELVALIMANEVASGKYQLPKGQGRAEAAIRIGLAIVTDGVTVAPIQGVSAVRTKQNQGGGEYLSVEFAGPIRSAGGTESALTLVIADQVRKALGLEKYNSTAFDDEVGRFVEELRIYERDVGNFQYKVSDQDVQKAISNLPVEIDGVWTDNYEVVVHRDMKRISSNRVRGGALRVLNDGIVGKSKKLLKLLGELNIDGWEWLSQLSGGKQQGTDETKQSQLSL